MSNMSKQKKTTILLVAVAVVLVIAALICWVTLKPRPSEGAKEITVNVTHTDGSTRTEDIHTDAEYLSEALEPYELISGEESEYGLFITEVDGEIADGTDGSYWVFDVNGAMGEYGADTQPVSDGDVYDFYTIVF